VSLLTRAPKRDDLVGLVYSLTPKPPVDRRHWYARPELLAGIVLAATVALNFLFW